MRRLRVGLYAFAVTALILLVVVVALISTDLGVFKGRIEVMATDMLGREFRVDGDLQVRVGTRLEIYAENVYLANPQWADNEAFLTAGKIDVAVDLWSLLSGPVVIKHLEFNEARVDLVSDASGDASWVFVGVATEDDDQSGVHGRLPLILEHAAVRDIQVSYQSAAMGKPIRFVADSLLSNIEDDSLKVEFTGSLNGTPINFVETIGPLENLFEYADVTTEITGSLGEISFSGSSWVDDLFAPHRPLLDIKIKGPNARYLTDIFSVQPVTAGPLELSVTIEESHEQMVASVSGMFGEFTINVGGHFQDIQELHNIDLNVAADGPDIGTIIRFLGREYPGSDSFKVRGEISRAGTEVTIDSILVEIGASRLTVDGLFAEFPHAKGGHLSLQASGPDFGRFNSMFGLPGRLSGSFTTSLNLTPVDDDRTRINLEALVDDDVFKIDGTIGNSPLAEETSLEFDFSGTDIAAHIRAFGGSANALPGGAYYLKGGVQGQQEKLALRDIRVAIGDDEEYQFQLSGSLTPAAPFVDSQLAVRAKGASLAALAELAGQQGIPDLPFDISTDIRRDQSNTYFEKGIFKSGTIVIEFAGQVGERPLEDDTALSFDANIPGMKDVIAEFGIAVDGLPNGDLIASGTLRRTGGKTLVENVEASIAGATLQVSGNIGLLPSLAGTDLTIVIEGENLARLLPPGFSREALALDFASSGNVSVSESELTFEQIRGNIGHTTMSGDFVIGREPFLGSGSIDIQVESPDVYHLLPKLVESAVPQTAKMQYRGRGNWEDNFWRVEYSNLQIGKGTLKISGTLDGPPSFEKTDLEVDWVSPSIRHLSILAGRKLPDHALRLNARLVGTNDVMTLENFELTLGGNDLHGQFTMRAGDVPFVKIDVDSRVLNIAEYLVNPEEEQQPEDDDKDPRIIPDTPLPLELLRSFDADIDISIKDMRTQVLEMPGFELHALVSSGALNIQELSFTSLRDGSFNLSAALTPNDDGGANLEMVAEGEGLVMGFRAETDEQLQALPLFEVGARIDAKGETVRELASSLDGHIRIVGGAGRVPAGSGSFFTQDLVTELLSAINPFTRNDPYTNVDCSVMLLQFDDGIAAGIPAFVEQTDKLRIFANAEIDLSTEKLDVDFRMTPRKGIGVSLSGIVNPYIKLAGTLGKPSIVLDPGGVAVEGGVALATGGLSILAKGFKDRFLADNDPCGSALAKADEKRNAQESAVE